MPSAEAWSQRILRVVDHVQSHLDAPLSADDLARRAGFSLHHFHRVFRGVTGESVMGMVRRLRLERAAQHLRFGQEPVTRVALQAGYDSHEGFTRAFRSHFGETPSHFRGQQRAPLHDTLAECRPASDRHCVALRHVGPYEECERAWARLMAWAGPAGWAQRSEASVGLCYDDPDVSPADRLRYDACLVLPEDALSSLDLPNGPYARRRIPGGLYATTLHSGSYESIFETYVALLGQWLPRRAVELADEPVVEHYLNFPDSTPTEDLRTEVSVRVVLPSRQEQT